MLIFVFLILTLWLWLDCDVRCVGTIYASVDEKIQKEMSLLSALTCVHHPMSLLRTSGMRPTDWLCLACEFRVAINEQSDITTDCKFQCLQFFSSSHYPFHGFDVQLCFVGAQCIESFLIVFWHILDVFLTFNPSCVFVQVVRLHEFRPLISLPKHDCL